MPVPKAETVIVEAFGMRKCPKLVEQVASENDETRRNALAVLCDEMHNPVSVTGCVEAGAVGILNQYVSKSQDAETKERASRAFAIMASDANGRAAMLAQNSAYEVIPAIDDVDVNVRSNVYEALVLFSQGPLPRLRSNIAAKYASTLVGKAASEVPMVQPLVLKLLYSCIRDEAGLADALGAGAVRTCLGLLGAVDEAVRKEAATTLCFLCFSEEAKQDAIKGGVVATLVGLLGDPAWEVRSAAAGALVAVTTTDEGKLAFAPVPGAVEAVVGLLASATERPVKLNALKCVANVVVHPDVREQMRFDEQGRVLRTLEEMEGGVDTLVAKHACIAKDAVLWEP